MTAKAKAVEFLRERLANRPIAAKHIKRAALARGFAPRAPPVR